MLLSPPGDAVRRMKHPQEDYAQALHSILVDQFTSPPSSTIVDIDGKGVHWHCSATRDDLSCRIACFDVRGPEYYTTFRRANEDMAVARTSNQIGTVDAASDWLDGSAVSELYARYAFVDASKHALSAISEHVGRAVPELVGAAELKHHGGDIYSLKFNDGDRSCLVSFYGKNAVPDARFAWDSCDLFKYQAADNDQLAGVLKRWVLDHAPPSAMRYEFPQFEIGSLADYYESGNPIEGEFIQSWDSIEEFYSEDWCTFSDSVLAMLRAMRDGGYDRQLRAGQSLSSLGLSRSRRHGLRKDQPCLWFDFGKSTMNVFAEFSGTTLKQHPIRFTPELRELLDSLVKHHVN